MLKIGWSEKDISTDKPVGIGGQFYIRVSKGVLDSLTVTSLTVENNGDYVIFLECDMTNVPNGVLKAIKEKVSAKNSEIDTSKILMNCTHTHTAPILGFGDDIGAWGKFSDIPFDGVEVTKPSEYTEFFIEKCVEAVCESYENRNDGQIAYGYGYAVVAHSRRVVYSKNLGENATDPLSRARDGYAKMYGKTNDPDFSHYEAGSDHYSNFMFTFDKSGKLTGAIVNIPCPSQNCEVEYYLSGDFWHDVRAQLREKYGNIYVLPQCAAAGDLAPRTLHYRKAEQRRYRLKYPNYKPKDDLVDPYQMWHRKEISERICDSFDEVYAWAKTQKYDNPTVVHNVKNIELDKRLVSKEEYEYYKQETEQRMKNLSFISTGDKDEDLKENTEKIRYALAYVDILDRYKTQKTEKTHKTDIHTIKIGEIAFASNQFELFMDFQHRIQARSPFIQTFIVELSVPSNCGSGSYLATERAANNKGYSAFIISNIVSPKGGEQLVEETLTELNKLAN